MTLGPGGALFDYLFEIVALIDAEKGKTKEIYQELSTNVNWKKQLRKGYEEIVQLQQELNDLQETADLYAALFSPKKVILKNEKQS
jgi:LytS/YehU family sensor histidine kinase